MSTTESSSHHPTATEPASNTPTAKPTTTPSAAMPGAAPARPRVEVELRPLQPEDRDAFIRDNQEAFRYGALEEFGVRNEDFEEDGEIISRSTIEESLDAQGAHAFRIVHEEQVLGGVVVRVEGPEGELDLLFVAPDAHSAGIGFATWCALEQRFSAVRHWVTYTPHFEKRNIHFYVNRCGFQITAYHRPLPEGVVSSGEERKLADMFRFEKWVG